MGASEEVAARRSESVERAEKFLVELRLLCLKHKATLVGCLTCRTPSGSVGSVAGVELVDLSASDRDAVAILHLESKSIHVGLSAVHGVTHRQTKGGPIVRPVRRDEAHG